LQLLLLLLLRGPRECLSVVCVALLNDLN